MWGTDVERPVVGILGFRWRPKDVVDICQPTTTEVVYYDPYTKILVLKTSTIREGKFMTWVTNGALLFYKKNYDPLTQPQSHESSGLGWTT